MKPGRIPCIVPFCRCTAAQTKHPGATEIICAKHWRRVPRALKARKRKIVRLLEKAEAVVTREIRGLRIDVSDEKRKRAAHRAAWKVWDRCKAAAIDAAGGIG
jgi:hypothetical protein